MLCDLKQPAGSVCHGGQTRIPCSALPGEPSISGGRMQPAALGGLVTLSGTSLTRSVKEGLRGGTTVQHL